MPLQPAQVANISMKRANKVAAVSGAEVAVMGGICVVLAVVTLHDAGRSTCMLQHM